MRKQYRTRHGFPYVTPRTKQWRLTTSLNWFTSDFKPQRLLIPSLIGTQRTVLIRGLRRVDWRRPIFVVRIAGKNYIRDGHHRAERARLRGQKTIASWVLDLSIE
jgi:hypothetical protein